MALGFSLGGNNSKSTSTGTFNRTSQPIVPDWATGIAPDYLSKINDLSSIDPQSLVSGPSTLETQASNTAAGLTGSPWNFDGAMNSILKAAKASTPTVSAASLLDNLGSYENPYINDVVNTALADYDANSGATRAAQDLDIARSGAFGGSGAALTKSLTEGELARGRASTDANLRFTAKDKAFGYSSQDADRRQSASLANAQLENDAINRRLDIANAIAGVSTAFDANQRANAGFQAELGGVLRGITDAQARAPFDFLGGQLGLIEQLGLDKYFGQQEQGTETTKGKNSGFSFGLSAGKK